MTHARTFEGFGERAMDLEQCGECWGRAGCRRGSVHSNTGLHGPSDGSNPAQPHQLQRRWGNEMRRFSSFGGKMCTRPSVLLSMKPVVLTNWRLLTSPRHPGLVRLYGNARGHPVLGDVIGLVTSPVVRTKRPGVLVTRSGTSYMLSGAPARFTLRWLAARFWCTLVTRVLRSCAC